MITVKLVWSGSFVATTVASSSDCNATIFWSSDLYSTIVCSSDFVVTSLIRWFPCLLWSSDFYAKRFSLCSFRWSQNSWSYHGTQELSLFLRSVWYYYLKTADPTMALRSVLFSSGQFDIIISKQLILPSNTGAFSFPQVNLILSSQNSLLQSLGKKNPIHSRPCFA